MHYGSSQQGAAAVAGTCCPPRLLPFQQTRRALPTNRAAAAHTWKMRLDAGFELGGRSGLLLRSEQEAVLVGAGLEAAQPALSCSARQLHLRHNLHRLVRPPLLLRGGRGRPRRHRRRRARGRTAGTPGWAVPPAARRAAGCGTPCAAGSWPPGGAPAPRTWEAPHRPARPQAPPPRAPPRRRARARACREVGERGQAWRGQWRGWREGWLSGPSC